MSPPTTFNDTVPLSVCVPVPRTVRMPSLFPEPILGSIRTVPPKSPSLSAWSTMLSLFAFGLVTSVCTLPALPLSVPARISELAVSWAVAAFSTTAFARSAVRPELALLLKRMIPSLIVSLPTQLLADGPVVGRVVLLKGVPKRNVLAPFFTTSATPVTAWFIVTSPDPLPPSVRFAASSSGRSSAMPPAPFCVIAGPVAPLAANRTPFAPTPATSV